jgi:hypothetical protein
MKSISFTYDPVSLTPFSISVYEDGNISKYGFYESGKIWAEQKTAKKPEWMSSTPFFELTEKMENLISSVADETFKDSEIISIIKEKSKQTYRLSGRFKEKETKPLKNSNKLPKRVNGINALRNSVDYRALSFVSDQKKKSPINTITTKARNQKCPKKAVNNSEIKSIMGNGQSRRLFFMIDSFNVKNESTNRRVMRRVNNISGHLYDDISDSSLRNRFINSSIEKMNRF